MARKPLIGTVAANVLKHGTGAINIGGCRVDGWVTTNPLVRNAPGFQSNGLANQGETGGGRTSEGRWPANLLHDGSDEVVALFPQSDGQSGAVTGNEPSSKTNAVYGDFNGRPASVPRLDSGSAARFFWCPKTSSADRHDGLRHPGPQFTSGSTLRDAENLTKRGNHHPTVKPTELMRYLCRLVTPPGGTVLDPFMGSGSTLKAAEIEGFNAIGIELDPGYIEIAKRRIAADAPLFADVQT